MRALWPLGTVELAHHIVERSGRPPRLPAGWLQRRNRAPTTAQIPGARAVTQSARPVVLIAEKLAPSVIDVLGDEVEVRHVDGTDRPALLSAVADADALLVRSATKVDAEVFAATTRLKVVARAGVGPGQRRGAGRHRARRAGRQRADLEHRLRRRARRGPAALAGPPHPGRGREPARRRVEAQLVLRRRDLRQDRRRGRPRQDRPAVRPAPRRLRHRADRLRPVRLAGPRRAARHRARRASTSCWPGPTSSRSTCPRRRRPRASSAPTSSRRPSRACSSSTPPAAG